MRNQELFKLTATGAWFGVEKGKMPIPYIHPYRLRSVSKKTTPLQ